jgi:hypothetical protein
MSVPLAGDRGRDWQGLSRRMAEALLARNGSAFVIAEAEAGEYERAGEQHRAGVRAKRAASLCDDERQRENDDEREELRAGEEREQDGVRFLPLNAARGSRPAGPSRRTRPSSVIPVIGLAPVQAPERASSPPPRRAHSRARAPSRWLR